MNLSSYKMHNGFLLVKSLKPDEKDEKSGLILSVEKDEQAQTSRCEVLLVWGQDDFPHLTEEYREKLVFEGKVSRFKPGDIVYFSKLVPDDVMIKEGKEEVELWFVREDDIKMSYGG